MAGRIDRDDSEPAIGRLQAKVRAIEVKSQARIKFQRRAVGADEYELVKC